MCIGRNGVEVAADDRTEIRSSLNAIFVSSADQRSSYAGCDLILAANGSTWKVCRVWLQPQTTETIDFQFQRLVVRGAEEVRAGRRARIAANLPRVAQRCGGHGTAGELRGVQVQQVGAIAREIVLRIVKQHLVCIKAEQPVLRNPSSEMFRHDRMRRRRDLLPRPQRRERRWVRAGPQIRFATIAARP